MKNALTKHLDRIRKIGLKVQAKNGHMEKMWKARDEYWKNKKGQSHKVKPPCVPIRPLTGSGLD